jgi:membrane glycosyltransferase
VWLAYDLPGSYEEMPPSLVDELKRDQRWCHGNLMNFRLFFLNGLHPAHRAVFMIGVMAYLSAPLWFASLLLSTSLLAVHTLSEPQYFVQPYQLFPLWPEWRPEWALTLAVATATLLVTPKLVSVLLVWLKGARHYGGTLRVGVSAIGELLMSMLLAPIRMLFHTQFVVTALLGWRVRWKSPPREDTETGWGEALRRHGWQTLLGLAWASGVYWLNPAFLWWLLPVVGALILSIPLSVLTSRVSIGRRLRRWKLFLIPEEVEPPIEIRSTADYARRARVLPDFVDAVMDPLTNALASASAVARLTQPDAMRKERTRLAHVALIEGPDALSGKQKALLLNDPLSLSRLHFQAWTSDHAHRVWQEARIAPSRSMRKAAKIPLPAPTAPALPRARA